MNIKEIEGLQSQIDSEYKKDKEAIKRVLVLLQKQNFSNGENEPATITAVDIVKNAISSMSGEFIISDVAAKVSGRVDKPQISTVLFAMVKKGELIVTEKGRGRKPTKYEKPK